MDAALDLRVPELPEKVFRRVAELAYEVAGIKLPPEKRELVKSRLIKRVRKLGLAGFDEYLARVESDTTGQELPRMIDILTTNKTDFFRENAHFEFLRDVVLPDCAARGARLRFWSAACSTGEEPYTLAMVLREALPDIDRRDVRILASDISARVLEVATAGVYRADQLGGVDRAMRAKYFTSTPGGYRVHDDVRRLVSFARLNLMQDWPMKGPFDMVFCRNVMIYFDKPTQERLVGRFYELIRPGGWLAVGHSESLTPLRHDYEFVQPATYRRPL